MGHLERSCPEGSPGGYGDPMMGDIRGVKHWMLELWGGS